MLFITQFDILGVLKRITYSALFGNFDAFVPCFAFSPGCEFASCSGADEPYPYP